jgi:hypothetical protein
MSHISTQNDPPLNPDRKRRRRRTNQENSDPNRSPRNRQTLKAGEQKRRGNPKSRQSRNRGSRGGQSSGTFQRTARNGERPKPALWRRLLETLTFGIFKADPYFVPGSERFARTGSTVQSAREKTGNRSATKQRSRHGSPENGRRNAERSKKVSSERTAQVIEVTSARCFVGNLSYDVAEEELQQLFSQAGTTNSVELVINSRTGRSKGYGFITMASIEEARIAVERFHNHDLKGRSMVVNGAKSSGPKDSSTSPEE